MKRTTCFSGALPLLLLLAALPLLPSCHQEEELSVPGGEIVFGASTSWRNRTGTRTEYTGLDGSGVALREGAALEQIHWLSSDKIRILSAQATSAYGAGVQHADYVVTPKSDAREGGIAPLTSSGSTVGAKGLQWGTTFPHVFYAVYPSPQQSDKVSVSLSGDNAVVSASIPAAQTGSWDGDTYKPDMDYAYMWSVASASSKGDVELSFRPLVTAFEVSLLAESSEMAAKTLTGVSLSSSAGGAALSGSFSATLTPTTAAGTPPVVSVAASPAPGTSVGITFPAADNIHLSQTSAKQFTLFALPVDQSQLTLTLTFSDGTTRSLKLKDADAVSATNPDGWIPIAASKKVILQTLSVPGRILTGLTLNRTSDIKWAGDPPVTLEATALYSDGTSEVVEADWNYKVTTPVYEYLSGQMVNNMKIRNVMTVDGVKSVNYSTVNNAGADTTARSVTLVLSKYNSYIYGTAEVTAYYGTKEATYTLYLRYLDSFSFISTTKPVGLSGSFSFSPYYLIWYDETARNYNDPAGSAKHLVSDWLTNLPDGWKFYSGEAASGGDFVNGSRVSFTKRIGTVTPDMWEANGHTVRAYDEGTLTLTYAITRTESGWENPHHDSETYGYSVGYQAGSGRVVYSISGYSETYQTVDAGDVF